MLIIKDALREIKFNKKRFVLLLIIIILSTSFYVGFNLTTKNAPLEIEHSDKESNIMDISTYSSLGFLKSDYDILKKVEGVNGIMMVKFLDVKATTAKDEFEFKVISISENKSKKNNDYINRLTLTNGRYPISINEGLIQEDFFIKNNLSIGDLITLKPEGKNEVKAKKIKIVGTVKNKYEIEDKKNVLYVEERNFGYDYYNELYITLDYKTSYLTDEYDSQVDEYKQKIKNALTPVLNDRYNDIKTITENNISSLQDKLNGYYTLSFPETSLNELINQTSKELEKEKKQLSKLKEPYILVKSKDEIPSFKKIKTEMKEMKKISSIFPLMILITGALSSSILINNKIDNDKKEFETLKKLGYKKVSICFKYILYAFSVSLIGSILGGLIFYKIIPIIFKTTNNLLNLNNTLFAFLITTIISVLIVSLKAIYLSNLSLRKITYNKPYKTKLENTFIWKKLSFSSKIILKDIIKNKKQTLLSIFVITVFSVLIITVFGILNWSEKGKITNIILVFILLIYLITIYYMSKDDVYNSKEEISIIKKLGFYDCEIINFKIKKNIIIILASLVVSLIFISILKLSTSTFRLSFLAFIMTLFIVFIVTLIASIMVYFNLRKEHYNEN